MHSNRLLVLLGGCLLAASAAMADDLGSVDCTSHPDATPVYAKARKSQDIVATMPCGEKFKVILFGFIFSEIQTSDGKVGFVFSNLVTVDRAAGTLQSRAASPSTPSPTVASETTKIPADPKSYSAPAQPKRSSASAASIADKMGGSASVQTQPAQAPAQDASVTAPAVSASAPVNSATPASASQPAVDVQPQPATAPAATQSAPAAPIAPQPAPAAAPSTSLPDSSTVLKATSSPNTDTAPNGAPAPQSPAAPIDAATAAPAPVSPDAPPASASTPATDASAPAPAPAEAAPAVAQPAAPEAEPRVVESAKVKRESWEKPNASARSLPLVELYGGFSYARTAGGGGTYNNMLGGVGSFGWNFKPWLQIAGDSSYNTLTISGTKNVLYGNHYGARYFFRLRNPFHITPFAEGLVGGSRVDATAGGTTISQNCLSYKIGGGLDFRSPHIHLFELRLIDFDYYRTAFGTNLYQNNYWISTGIVLRLFGGRNAD